MPCAGCPRKKPRHAGRPGREGGRRGREGGREGGSTYKLPLQDVVGSKPRGGGRKLKRVEGRRELLKTEENK